MVFNWFRRQYSATPDEPSEEQAQTTPPESEAPNPAAESSAPPSSESSAAAEDYLSWAKAAYQNIQKQKAFVPTSEVTPDGPASETTPESIPSVESVTSSPVGVEEVAQPLETTAPIAETEVETPVSAMESVSELSPEEAISPIEPPVETLSPVSTVEAVAPSLEISEPVTPTSSVEEAPSVVATEATEATLPSENLPFWAKAEAERQARIERLKETAIEEPEPDPLPTADATQSPFLNLPDLAFDEGFLWSAEILASQGRRPDQISVEEITWLQKLRRGLERTRLNLINQLKAIVGQGPLNQDAVAEIEALLLQADVGVEATDIIITALQKKLREETLPPEQAIAYLKQLLRELLDSPCQETAVGNPAYSLTFAPEKETFNIWLIVGVNGAGKTTTIGKIARIAQKSGYKTLIAAADTFRAAAVEQLKIWAERSGVDIIANPGKNTDPAAVVFDAIAAAQARGTELLIVDTAGRLQNKKNLMDELSKIRRIVDKKAPGAIVESLLVLDATLGQNGLRQAEVFSEAARLSGVVLTKLDGTAKGGVALAVVQQLGLPIRFIGVGESVEDLRPFSSYEFVEALLNG